MSREKDTICFETSDLNKKHVRQVSKLSNKMIIWTNKKIVKVNSVVKKVGYKSYRNEFYGKIKIS